MKTYIGIDPGGSGGIATINSDGKLIQVVKMPDTPLDILNYIRGYDPDNIICCIERVHGMPGMGGASMFKFGKNFGYLTMALLANNIQTYDPTPQKWMKAFQLVRGKTESKTEWKNRLKAMAQQMYPQAKITLSTADAILIAAYCWTEYS